MSWIKKEFPFIPGYEMLSDSVEAKAWLNFRLDMLLDIESISQEYQEELKRREDICDFIILQFDYPMVRGLPSDVHKDNWFQGLCCHQITQDYWQKASETLRTLKLNQRRGKKGYGDCEDVSILFTNLFLTMKWKAYECFGAVLDSNYNLLGYHGWSIFEDKHGNWWLYEATLSEPPKYLFGYFPIDPNLTSWEINGLIYSASVKFNKEEYFECELDGDLLVLVLGVNFKSKETRKKYEAISRAWRQKTKPVKKVGLLSKLRWR